MTISSLFPAYVEMRYQTAWGVHVSQIPTLGYSNSGFADAGSFETHDAVGIAGDVMVEGLIDLMALAFNATSKFLDYTIYTKASADAPPLPKFGKAYVEVGTNTLTGVDRAVQQTYTFRTEGFGHMRVVQLDRHTNNYFGKTTAIDSLSQDWVDYIMDSGNGFAGRDGTRPGQFLGVSITLNSRLERKYLPPA